MSVLKERFINEEVVAALKLDDEHKRKLVKKLTPRFLHKIALNFAGTIGSETYNQFASANLNEIYGDRLDDALHFETNTFENVWFENDNGKFVKHTLPNLAQIAPIFGMLIEDFTGNGRKDILIAGNLYTAEVETGNADAGYGLLLEGQNDKSFMPKRFEETGFIAPFDVRDMELVRSSSGKNIALVANNRNRLQVYAFNLK